MCNGVCNSAVCPGNAFHAPHRGILSQLVPTLSSLPALASSRKSFHAPMPIQHSHSATSYLTYLFELILSWFMIHSMRVVLSYSLIHYPFMVLLLRLIHLLRVVLFLSFIHFPWMALFKPCGSFCLRGTLLAVDSF